MFFSIVTVKNLEQCNWDLKILNNVSLNLCHNLSCGATFYDKVKHSFFKQEKFGLWLISWEENTL